MGQNDLAGMVGSRLRVSGTSRWQRVISRSELILGPGAVAKHMPLLRSSEKLSHGVLTLIGLVMSFTKKAGNEAVERAGSAFNLHPTTYLTSVIPRLIPRSWYVSIRHDVRED